MLHSDCWPSTYQCSSKPKLGIVYILLLLVSFSFASTQSKSYNHQIDNRSPEIDPYWYVGRGVRPIGRFGKRLIKKSGSLQPGLSHLLELILNHFKSQEGLDMHKAMENRVW